MTDTDKAELQILIAAAVCMANFAFLGNPMLGAIITAFCLACAYASDVMAWKARRDVRRALHRDLRRVMTREEIDEMLDEVRRRR